MVLRVSLDIVPYGLEEKAFQIGCLDIFNKGTVVYEPPDRVVCNYGVIDLTPGQEGLFTDTVLHNRPDGAWKLVQTCLAELDIDGPK